MSGAQEVRNVIVKCVHGDRVSHLLARVEVTGWKQLQQPLNRSVMLVPELVKIGPTVHGPMKSWAMAATMRAQAKKRREDTRTEHKEAEWCKRQACGGTVG